MVCFSSPTNPISSANFARSFRYPIETNVAAAQSFSPTANFTATRIALYVQDSGKSDALAISVVPDVAGHPDTLTILATASNDTASAFAWANFTLTPSLAVTAGTTYWIVADDSAGTGEGYAWRYVSVDAYPRGNAATANGAVWTSQAGDFAFVVYGWTPAAVTISVIADRATVAGGDLLGYMIQLTNTGTEDATSVWINATLDSRLQFASAGPAPVTFAGGVVSFRPATLPAGITYLYLNTTVRGLFQDNGSLVLPVTAEFFNGVAARSLSTAVTVGTHAPDVVATIASRKTEGDAGSILTFEVTLRNRGSASAGHVWLNESLNPSLTYLNDTAVSPAALDGQRQSWHLTGVAPGTTQFNVTVQVDPLAAGDTVVANFLSVEFTDTGGTGLVRGRTNTVVFRVLGAFVDGGGGSNPWLWGSFVLSATVVGGTYLFLARRRLRTEEIFLIHHSGVLLVHMSKSMKADHDSDILSGMFTAIMSFVKDAFHYDGQQELQGLDLGKYRVHVRKGAITFLALVHTGKSTRWLLQTATRAVIAVESEYLDMLKDWNGDVRALTGVRDILKGYFLSPTGPSRSMQRLRATFSRFDQTFKGMRPL